MHLDSQVRRICWCPPSFLEIAMWNAPCIAGHQALPCGTRVLESMFEVVATEDLSAGQLCGYTTNPESWPRRAYSWRPCLPSRASTGGVRAPLTFLLEYCGDRGRSFFGLPGKGVGGTFLTPSWTSFGVILNPSSAVHSLLGLKFVLCF